MSGEGRAVAGSSQSGGDFFPKKDVALAFPSLEQGKGGRDEAELGLRLSFSHTEGLREQESAGFQQKPIQLLTHFWKCPGG